MEKLDLQTQNFTDENIKKLAILFPNCVTESRDDKGRVKKAIDFDLLKQELAENIVDGPRERYQINWPGKRESLITANTPINKTLRPCREESVDFDTTQNLYIEGDNLEALKLLQESYLNKVKMIYIDPPYNTGKDFVYKDNFTVDKAEYELDSEQRDEEGGRLVANTEANGRYHSDWLSMIYPRLKLARNLLKDNGVIFISIDDNEVHSLRKICDEIFGEENFISSIAVQSNPRGRQSDTFVATVNDYLLVYAKNISSAEVNGMPLTEKQKMEFNCTDEISGEKYRLLGLRQRGSASRREDRPDMYFPIYVNPRTLETSLEENEDWEKVLPSKSDNSDGRWMWGREKCRRDQNLLISKLIERRGEHDIFVKDYLNKSGAERTRKYKSIWDSKEYNNQAGTQEVKALFQATVMSFPKSKHLLCDICRMGMSSNDLVLDFFSGSSTTAQAIMQLNVQDNGIRKFIMVQLPEKTNEKSEAFKSGFKNIADIGKERIRRAGKKIKEENAGKEGIENLDTGFRVLKVDSSNMNDVYYAPDEVNQSLLDLMEKNIKEGRTAEDLLFHVLLDWGLDLSAKIVKEEIQGKAVYFVNDDDLVACFDDGVSEELVKALAKREMMRVVFKDTGFAKDEIKDNVEQIFKQLSPKTEVRAI